MSSLVRRMLTHARTAWLEGFVRRVGYLEVDSPVVSVAFDDVPRSAVENGLPILNEFGTEATFYTSLGLGSNEEFLGIEDLQELHGQGHEIGCHTYSHYRLSTGSCGDFLKDAERNRNAITMALNGVSPVSFSFPFGDMNLRLKKRLQEHYTSLRSSRPGVNFGAVDLNCLRAISLRSDEFSTERVSKLLEDAERSSGWLIFYTHGIRSDAGRFDLTADMLGELLFTCRAHGALFRRVGEVVAGMRELGKRYSSDTTGHSIHSSHR